MRFVTAAALALALPFTALLAEQPRTPPEPAWAFEESDIPLDPAFRFGVLANGMRYVLRENATPQETALVRLHIGSGSLDENDSERGLAHFLEHMAFNGSRRIPEGEMVKLLEREGLAFGADTNASTGFEQTVYKLNLPRNDPALLDTALMLMRETASELTITPAAVERERGVVLSERRDRRNFAYKNTEDQLAFISPGARYAERLPVGTIEVLESAGAEELRGFYRRTYVPANAVLVIVGDFPLDRMEEAVRRHFDDWAGPADLPEPGAGPVKVERRGETDIYIDPALPERMQVMRLGPWDKRPDTVATRQQNLLRQVGYGIINRRFQTLARAADAPFRGAGYGTGDVFEAARLTSLVIDSENGKWQRGLAAATQELRRALTFGFTEAEVAEQLARIRTSLENAARASTTRSNDALVDAALQLVEDGTVPSPPQSALERFEAFAPDITPAAALAVMLAEATPLEDPLIRFEGRESPAGGADQLRQAWDDAAAAQVADTARAAVAPFAYSDFGTPGDIVSDTRDDRFGLRLIRFANGVRLNLRQTQINKDRIGYRLTLDGGQLLDTRDHPLRTALVSALPQGGLGAHGQDELESILAGRSVRLAIGASEDAFEMGGATTPRDLDLQLRLFSAMLTDPGYRLEGEERFRRNLKTFFASLDATPARALDNQLGAILSDGDPRFSLQSEADYQALTFARLALDIGDRLQHGAIELALVGDLDEQATIDAVARTLGALPMREAEFQPREDVRLRPFTAARGLRTITHSGEPDQALIRLTWPTTDDRDLAEALRLSLLDRVVQIELQEQLREDLGKSYSPSSSSAPSRTYRGYGTFNLAASVDIGDVAATRGAIRALLGELRSGPVDADVLARARQPLLESYDNLLKSLSGWLSLADRAQSEAYRLDRFLAAPEILKAITPDDILATAQRYLAPDEAVEIVVEPGQQSSAP